MSEIVDFIKSFQTKQKEEYEAMSRAIWEHPETAYKEVYACRVQTTFLKEKGFVIDATKGDVPNAIYASWGNGKPVLAFLGEYDALPAMSQESGVNEKKPVKEGEPGHGCGHNLLGTASLEAAVMTASYLKEHEMDGTVVYLACPGEESGAGKAFMLRQDYFKDIDFAFTWHPTDFTGMMRGTLANVRVKIKFFGKRAHAAAAPWDGRSALDACELTNIGVNYLREHVRPEVRMHYAYLNSGGKAPNIVPDEAELIYALRAPEDQLLVELTERLKDIAKGAALMTGTEAEVKTLSYYASVTGTTSLDCLIYQILCEKYPVAYSEEEVAYANIFSNDSDRDNLINQKVLDFDQSGASFSTDAGNVSQKIPMGIFNLTSYVKHTNLHTWLSTAQGIGPVAHKNMHIAAEVMSQAALMLSSSEELQKKIKEEFAHRESRSLQEVLFPETITLEEVRKILP